MAVSEKESNSRQESIRRLGKAIKEIRIAMMTTVDPDGELRSRPMATQEAEFDGQIWFFTKESSGKVHSIVNDQHVNLSYVDVNNNRYASIAGRARLVRDKEKMAELWSPALRAWFPDGLEDSEIALIGVEVDSAEIWDAPSGALVHLLGFAKSVTTGQPLSDKLTSERVEVDSRH
jgi:general stress protein 26